MYKNGNLGYIYKESIIMRGISMKKLFLLVAVTVLAGIFVFAQDQEAEPAGVPASAEESGQNQNQKSEDQGMPIEFHLTYFNFGIGLHFPFELEGNVKLINVGIEDHKITGLGATFSPFYILGYIGLRMRNVHAPKINAEKEFSEDSSPVNENSKVAFLYDAGASIINTGAYWNVARFLFRGNDNLYLGPFVNFNWLFINFFDGGIDTQRFRLQAGLQVGKFKGDLMKFNIFSVELGYLLDGNHYPGQVGYGINIGPNDSKFCVEIKFGR